MEKYKDKSLPVQERVEDLLGRMTLQEKLGQLNQRMFGWNAYKKTEDGYAVTQEFVEEVAFGDGLGALYGLFRADPWSRVTVQNGIPLEDCARVTNMLQRHVIEGTRLGIPLLISEECPHGHMALNGTIFPTNLGIGATWNPALYEQAFACVAAEIRACGGNLGLVSALDILQDPRWGRSEECFGEDPYLSSCMTAAVTRGLQGTAHEELCSNHRVIAVLKHFCAQGAAMGGHNGKAAVIGERELREIHLPAMKAGVDAGALGCMAAYNEIDGIYCHGNRRLLTDILRGEWGFEGLVMSDGCAVDNLKRLTGSEEGAAALAVGAGVDLNLWNHSYLALPHALKRGMLSEEVVDQAVARVLRTKFMLGLFENAYTDEKLAVRVVGNETFRETNLAVARESVVLLKNHRDVLPMKKDLRRIAVIGPNAHALYNQLGDYTPPQREGTGATVLQGVQALVSENTEVLYERGCGIRDSSTEGFAAAIEAAKKSDAVILVLGGSSARRFGDAFDQNGAAIVSDVVSEMDCGEGVDVANLELGGVQEALAKELAATGVPMVVVLIQGRPHAIPWIAEHCDAVLCAWYPGKEGGRAVADILFGDVNPSGKLPVSIPRSAAQLPVYYNYKEISDYLDHSAGPLYPFGFGLSYTSFAYRALSVSSPEMSLEAIQQGESFVISVCVENTGAVAGSEVVQLYIADQEATVSMRVKELKGFEKVHLQPGERREVFFRLGREELAVWNVDMVHCVEPGNIRVMVGASSDKTCDTMITIL